MWYSTISAFSTAWRIAASSFASSAAFSFVSVNSLRYFLLVQQVFQRYHQHLWQIHHLIQAILLL